MVVAAEPGVMVALVRDDDTGPSCRLRQHLGGRLLRWLLVEQLRNWSPAVEPGLGRPPTEWPGVCVGVR